MNKFLICFILLLLSGYQQLFAQEPTYPIPPSAASAASAHPTSPATAASAAAPTTSEPTQNMSKEQFSTLAFSNPTNTSDDDINITIKPQERMGALLKDTLPVFGMNLFGNQCKQLHPTNYFNPEYRITVGDQVNLQMWGAYTFNQALMVDTQGNIFVPEVGPIKLKGVENSQLNKVVERYVKKIFSKDVHVYADLVTAQPVQVYVAGYVNEPGLYDGLSSDSVIYFLCKAGGVNLKEGSLRAIHIIRQGKQIAAVDLYDFMLRGNINHFQLHPGDTIVVKPQGYVVSVDGNVNHAYQYEWLTPNITMSSLIERANIDPTVTFARIQRNQGNKPEILYKQLSEVKKLILHDGDKVTFVADHEVNQIIVTVKGQVLGKHQFVINKSTTLANFVKELKVAPQANINNIQLYRESVAKQQKEAIGSSLSRLQRQAMTTGSTTEAGAKMQVSQAELIMKFVNEAKQVEMKGQVVLGDSSRWNQIYLENNDVINVPQVSSVVTVSGDVVNSLSVDVKPNNSIVDYIAAAGGLDKTANTKELLLVKQNGQVHVIAKNSWSSRRGLVEGGDQLIILPQVSSENWQVTESLTKILYQVAIAAKVALIAV